MSRSGTLTAPDAERAGTAYYVPEVRVAKLGLRLLASSEPGNLLPKDVLGDLVRAEVTRVNSGPSLYSLTFNNWFLSTAEDRRRQGDAGTGGPRESIDPENKAQAPFWPRFKYNDFSFLCFGDRLRIDMRYVPEPTGTKRTLEENEQSWTPMVSGPITDIRFSFAAGEGAQITVSGEDDLSVLKDKHEGRVPMKRKAEVSIVEAALKAVAYPLAIAKPLVSYPDFATHDGQGIEEALADGQSPLDLIQKLAGRLDFEVFLEFAKPPATAQTQPQIPPLEFHFEPYRGRAVPDEKLRSIYRLDRGGNLLEFNPTIKLSEQYSTVVVKGRHRDPRLAKEVKGEAIYTILDDELHRDLSKDSRLTSGPEMRDVWFFGRENKLSLPNQANLDDVRADWAASAVIRKKARELFTIEAKTLGEPRIRPGRHVEIRGMRPPFDGFYYVTKTVHTFGVDGYRTHITASRPGMEFPPYVVKPKKGASS